VASRAPSRATTDHANDPPPKPARGVKIVAGVAACLLALVGLAVWALLRALL
jgi:hypothetical protein